MPRRRRRGGRGPGACGCWRRWVGRAAGCCCDMLACPPHRASDPGLPDPPFPCRSPTARCPTLSSRGRPGRSQRRSPRRPWGTAGSWLRGRAGRARRRRCRAASRPRSFTPHAPTPRSSRRAGVCNLGRCCSAWLRLLWGRRGAEVGRAGAEQPLPDAPGRAAVCCSLAANGVIAAGIFHTLQHASAISSRPFAHGTLPSCRW